MKNPCFSVIMPCYNSEAYVEKAIKSIVGQTYPFWELIIVNDGSCDNTLNIVNEYAEKDDRIKVYSKKNGGYATAVNYGLDHVNGDYFLFLGSDDYLDIHLFERLQNAFIDHGLQPDMVAFRTRIVSKDGTIKEIETYTNFKEALLTRASFTEFNRINPQYSAIYSIRDTSRCYKTSLLGDTRYFGKTGMDADGIFSMMICHKASSFINLPIDGYYWCIRGNSVSSTVSLTKQLDRLENWYMFFEYLSSLDADQFTSAEKKYFEIYGKYITDLTYSPGNSIKYRSFIKRKAKHVMSLAHKFEANLNQFPYKYLRLSAKTPLLFSLLFMFWTKLHCRKKR